MGDSFTEGIGGLALLGFSLGVLLVSVPALFGSTFVSLFLTGVFQSYFVYVAGIAFFTLLASLVGIVIGFRMLAENENTLFNYIIGIIGLILVLVGVAITIASDFFGVIIGLVFVGVGLGMAGLGFEVERLNFFSEKVFDLSDWLIGIVEKVPLVGTYLGGE